MPYWHPDKIFKNFLWNIASLESILRNFNKYGLNPNLTSYRKFVNIGDIQGNFVPFWQSVLNIFLKTRILGYTIICTSVLSWVLITILTNLNIQRFQFSSSQLIEFFSCDEQLKKWRCHSVCLFVRVCVLFLPLVS